MGVFAPCLPKGLAGRGMGPVGMGRVVHGHGPVLKFNTVGLLDG